MRVNDTYDEDTLVRIVNKAQHRNEIVDRTISQGESSTKTRIPVKGKRKNKENKIVINKRVFTTGVVAIGLVASLLGVDIGSKLQKASTINSKYNAELKSAQEKLIDNNLAFLNEKGELKINDNTSARDYANIATSDFTFVDASCYYDLIDYREMDKLVQNIEIFNDKGHYYTDFNQYCRINGVIDSNGYPNYSMLYNLAKKEIAQSLNESTFIDENETYYDTNIGGRSQ